MTDDPLDEAARMVERAMEESNQWKAFVTLCRAVTRILKYLIEQRIARGETP